MQRQGALWPQDDSRHPGPYERVIARSAGHTAPDAAREGTSSVDRRALPCSAMSDVPEFQGPPRRGGPGQGHHADRGQGEDAALLANRALELRMAGVSYEAIRVPAPVRGTGRRRRGRCSGSSIATSAAPLTCATSTGPCTSPGSSGWIRAIWSKVIAGDLGAFHRLVRLLERQARLLGLGQPRRRSRWPATTRSRAPGTSSLPLRSGCAGDATAAENRGHPGGSGASLPKGWCRVPRATVRFRHSFTE